MHSPQKQLELKRTDRYVVYECIAKGGMASVHIGLLQGSLGFSRVVAIKRLHAVFTGVPRVVQMLVEEARLVSRIRHMNVVPTLDVIEADGEVFVVMEYVRGAALSRLVADSAGRGELVHVPTLAAVMVGALRGVHAAHEATDLDGTPLGIVHRDLSPQNILVGVGGLPRVIDFGVARALTSKDVTQEGEFKGKLAYASPEQATGEPVTRRSDVFAAGIILWELLTGHRLFLGEGHIETYRNVLVAEVEHPRHFYEVDETVKKHRTPTELVTLGDIAMRALERDPERRYASAADMAAAIEQAVPVASLATVGAWVQSCAADQLAVEHSIVSTIERRAGQMRSEAPEPEHAKSEPPPKGGAPEEPTRSVAQPRPREAPAHAGGGALPTHALSTRTLAALVFAAAAGGAAGALALSRALHG